MEIHKSLKLIALCLCLLTGCSSMQKTSVDQQSKELTQIVNDKQNKQAHSDLCGAVFDKPGKGKKCSAGLAKRRQAEAELFKTK